MYKNKKLKVSDYNKLNTPYTINTIPITYAIIAGNIITNIPARIAIIPNIFMVESLDLKNIDFMMNYM